MMTALLAVALIIPRPVIDPPRIPRTFCEIRCKRA